MNEYMHTIKVADLDKNNPYKKVHEITDDQFSDTQFDTVTIMFRHLIDNYSNLFACAYARLYEALLINMYEVIDIELMELMQKLDYPKADGMLLIHERRKIAKEQEPIIKNELKGLIEGNSSLNYIIENCATIMGVQVGNLKKFAKAMATIELEFLNTPTMSITSRFEAEDKVIRMYADHIQNEFVRFNLEKKDFPLMKILDYLDSTHE